jgi:hypothetical protein
LRCLLFAYLTTTYPTQRISPIFQVSDLAGASKGVHDTSTKLVLVLKADACTPDGAASICDVFAESLEVLVTGLAGLRSARPSAPLWQEAWKAAHALAAAAAALAAVVNRDGPASDTATQAVGVVWALSAQPFSALPKSNRVAYRRAVMTQSAMVKETTEEFEDVYKRAGPTRTATATTTAAAATAAATIWSGSMPF